MFKFAKLSVEMISLPIYMKIIVIFVKEFLNFIFKFFFLVLNFFIFIFIRSIVKTIEDFNSVPKIFNIYV